MWLKTWVSLLLVGYETCIFQWPHLQASLCSLPGASGRLTHRQRPDSPTQVYLAIETVPPNSCHLQLYTTAIASALVDQLVWVPRSSLSRRCSVQILPRVYLLFAERPLYCVFYRYSGFTFICRNRRIYLVSEWCCLTFDLELLSISWHLGDRIDVIDGNHSYHSLVTVLNVGHQIGPFVLMLE